jgi:hypothetical protein
MVARVSTKAAMSAGPAQSRDLRPPASAAVAGHVRALL